MYIVESRSTSVLFLIKIYRKAGSIIHFENWKAFRSLSNLDDLGPPLFCQKYIFVNSITGVHIAT
ncbi:hypothetical protein AAJ76_2500001477 [Vairimorpha ceranae]|uniref:ISXO2-like transposase domain-containing protein n=1 Tax=Vairimorpha ceranae TaxID=40302 RepID=A0A0F9W9V5_9MICR|nr:hypothetical protein AAJ76_2500001477 [Vairimorpha ceranae]KKO73755.1 hypothetical protein AAJ76_2500001477 [Vairimorpha ceranae]